MYNRYIPQPDGTYRKNRIPDPVAPTQTHRPQPKPNPPANPVCPPVDPPFPPPPVHKEVQNKHIYAGDFLRRLLPKEIDTGDLLIVLLLLLMAGDSKDDNNTALLTLALYFFL
ncbi:MAG: hypothetical protein IJF02_02365 [Oscillospiraceae bacterium]|nr:hypothetical protein [Oscillospiraceae bacterium]